jgi:hypothetical protein
MLDALEFWKRFFTWPASKEFSKEVTLSFAVGSEPLANTASELDLASVSQGACYRPSRLAYSGKLELIGTPSGFI